MIDLFWPYNIALILSGALLKTILDTNKLWYLMRLLSSLISYYAFNKVFSSSPLLKSLWHDRKKTFPLTK